MKRHVPLFIIIIALVSFLILGERQIRRNSVTADEFVHLPVGLTYLKTHDFSFDRRGNPPLMRFMIALPVNKWKPIMRFGERWKSGDFYGVGWEFMIDNAERYVGFFRASRWMILMIGALLVIVVARVAIEAYGWWAGALAAALTGFSANVIAHSSLATLDVGLAFIFLSAQFALLEVWRRPGFWAALFCGLNIGLAMLVKYTGMTLVVFQCVCLGVVLMARMAGKRRGATAFSELASLKKVIPFYLIALLIALFTLNFVYGFHGTFAPLGDMQLKGKLFGSLADAAGWLRLPLPSDYILGLDAAQFATGKYHTFYLMGELSKDGWWHYFIVTYLVKESIPAILLFLIALFSILKMRLRAEEIFFLVPAAGIFFFYSFVARVDLGIRYLLPALPFIYVFTSRLASVDFGRFTKEVRVGFAALLVWHAAGTALVSPYLLAYFNEAAGGPEGGHRYVIESNYDWGQNLVALKQYMDDRGIGRLMLRNYGLVSPQLYGIRSDGVPCEPTRGLIAISPNYVNGIDPFMRREKCYEWLREYEPVDKVGYSLFIYKINQL